MTHDYTERMSLMLDGRLSAQERAEFEAHLAVCGECHARWEAFQQVHRVLSDAVMVMSAPGFAHRFAARLARQAQRSKRERAMAWVGVFAAGTAALALLIIPTVVAAWSGVNGLIESAPTMVVTLLEGVARWLVTLSALGEAGRSIVDTLFASGGPILIAYAMLLVFVTAAWITVMRGVSRRSNRVTLPVLLWL